MLKELKQSQLIWYANEYIEEENFIRSGYSELDEVISGIPEQGIINIKTRAGSGEFRLLLNYIANKQQQGLVASIQSPYLFSCEFLHQQKIKPDQLLYIKPKTRKDASWAIEQCIKSGVCSCVLCWQTSFTFNSIRRLSLACEEAKTSLIIFSDCHSESIAGAKLTLALQQQNERLKINVIKARGRKINTSPVINMNNYWPALYQVNNTRPFEKSVTFAS